MIQPTQTEQTSRRRRTGTPASPEPQDSTDEEDTETKTSLSNSISCTLHNQSLHVLLSNKEHYALAFAACNQKKYLFFNNAPPPHWCSY